MSTPIISRWDRRISRLSQLNQTFGNWRTGFFVLMMALILLGVVNVFPDWSFLGAGISLLLFFVLLWRHRRLRRALELFQSRQRLARRQEAIRELKWADIPASSVGAPKGAPQYLSDLNIVGEESFMHLIDQTISKDGAQRLLQLFLSQDVTGEEIDRRTRLVQELKGLTVLRNTFLTRLNLEKTRVENEEIQKLFQEPLSKIKTRWELLPIALIQVAFLVCLYLSAQGMQSPLFMLSAFALVFENLRLRGRILVRQGYAWSLSAAVSLDQLGTAVSLLEKHSTTPKKELQKILQAFRPERSASRRLRQLDQISGALGVRQNFIVHGLLHLVVPWDLLWTLRLENLRQHIQYDLNEWQKSLAEFEAFLSLAMYAEAFPEFTVASRREDGKLLVEARELRHPLLHHKVAVGNPLQLDSVEKCVLLTGSNMSGKSTFLRSVGINYLLAKAGAPVAADAFLFESRPLFTSLSGGDSLQEGLSSFYAEVRRLKEILDYVREKGSCLFLIDEIFRGTNNRERLIGSQAYIRELVSLGGQGIVTSHDLELSQLESLGIGVYNYHFRETIQGSEMSFSYRKERGPCPTTNALRVMSLNGLPVGDAPNH